MSALNLEAERTSAKELDDQILALEWSLSELRAQRALVQEQLDSYKYPVLTLPNEIVCEIFIHSLPLYPECPPPTGIHSPTKFTQICRQWRGIALATPALWRAIRLVPYTNIAQQELDTWLSRSLVCPFSLKLGDIYDLENPGTDLVISSAECARLEHLKMMFHRPQFIIQGPLPFLRHLDLWYGHLSPANNLVVRDAPLLRSVVLNQVAARLIVLPWVQLTRLTLVGVFLDECVSVLQRAPNLVFCLLTLILYNIRPMSSIPDVTLPHLESLTLTSALYITQLRGYLETFIAPALRHLQVEETLLGDDRIMDIKSFVSKSRCMLEGMRITGIRSVSQDAYRRAFPSVGLSFDDENYVEPEDDIENDFNSDSDSE